MSLQVARFSLSLYLWEITQFNTSLKNSRHVITIEGTYLIKLSKQHFRRKKADR
jgi:hypothetical protein